MLQHRAGPLVSLTRLWATPLRLLDALRSPQIGSLPAPELLAADADFLWRFHQTGCNPASQRPRADAQFPRCVLRAGELHAFTL